MIGQFLAYAADKPPVVIFAMLAVTLFTVFAALDTLD